MLTQQNALAIAHDWLKAWNDHDLDAILSHYAENVDFTSPLIAKLMGHPQSRIQGKAKLREYFAKGLAAYPDLKFTPLQLLVGFNSLVIYYRSVNDLLSAEFMMINSDGLVSHVNAHYSSAVLEFSGIRV